MTARIDPAHLCSPKLLWRSSMTTRRPPRMWRSLSRAEQDQLASTLAEMARRAAAGAAAELGDVGDHSPR